MKAQFAPSVMLMVTSSFALALAQSPDAKPSETETPICSKAQSAEPGPGELVRLAGDMTAKVEAIPTNTEEGGKVVPFQMYRFGDMKITTPLPEGYPAPTPPKAIDIKGYPLVRRAQVKGETNPDIGMNVGFWPLFNHIKNREIAMTSPVEMEYGTSSVAAENQTDPAAPSSSSATSSRQWTMAFLYRTSDMGPTGKAEDNQRVEVVDVPPMTVLSMGFKGIYSRGMFDQSVSQLKAELAKLPDWEAAGEPRALYYNGPEVPNGRKWGEVQVPIKRKATSSSDQMVPVKVEVP